MGCLEMTDIAAGNFDATLRKSRSSGTLLTVIIFGNKPSLAIRTMIQ
jgi:hypothetical protein